MHSSFLFSNNFFIFVLRVVYYYEFMICSKDRQYFLSQEIYVTKDHWKKTVDELRNSWRKIWTKKEKEKRMNEGGSIVSCGSGYDLWFYVF